MWRHFKKISESTFTSINTNLTRKKIYGEKQKVVHTKIRWEAQSSLLWLWVFKSIVFTWLKLLIKILSNFLLEVTGLTEFTFRKYVWKIYNRIIMAFQVAFQVKTMFCEMKTANSMWARGSPSVSRLPPPTARGLQHKCSVCTSPFVRLLRAKT